MLLSEHVARTRRIEALRTRDAILTVATPAELAASATSRVDLGRVWNGMGNALSTLQPSQQAKAMDEVKAVVSKYIGESGWPVSANGTAFTGSSPNEQARSTADRIAAINRANRAHYGNR